MVTRDAMAFLQYLLIRRDAPRELVNGSPGKCAMLLRKPFGSDPAGDQLREHYRKDPPKEVLNNNQKT